MGLLSILLIFVLFYICLEVIHTLYVQRLLIDDLEYSVGMLLHGSDDDSDSESEDDVSTRRPVRTKESFLMGMFFGPELRRQLPDRSADELV